MPRGIMPPFVLPHPTMAGFSAFAYIAFLSALLLVQVNCAIVSGRTNAERMSLGLPPAPPKRLYAPTRVRRLEPAVPSPTLCSQIGSRDMAIELHKYGDGTLLGFIGKSTYYNTVYNNFGGTTGQSRGMLWNVEQIYYKNLYRAITVAGNAPHAFCAASNDESTQDLYAPNNFLYNVDCTQSGGVTQRRNYKWHATGEISLQWTDVNGYDIFPIPYYNTQNKLFRWYAPGAVPPSNLIPTYLKWSCVAG
ncbi:hypothetical protein R3P38DRAFT_619622 [Favolaschia claudopus]|uniref:Uncharacterized protein n=1 Tax=Favolaschia claudopus TaxID=2862362 RepID=A0AAW0CDE7_9AGAR